MIVMRRKIEGAVESFCRFLRGFYTMAWRLAYPCASLLRFGSLYIDKLRRFTDDGKLHTALLHIIKYKVKYK